MLRPDLFVSLGVGDFEHRWFCEVDRGTEHLPAILRKCRQYEAYYATGAEQRDHGVFPRACWIVPDQRRADHGCGERRSDERADDERADDERARATTSGSRPSA